MVLVVEGPSVRPLLAGNYWFFITFAGVNKVVFQEIILHFNQARKNA